MKSTAPFGEAAEYPTRVPESLSPQCVFIEDALVRLTADYQKAMLESNTTESFLASEYLIAHADEVLDLNARARALGTPQAEQWLQVIHQRVDRIIYMRRPR